MILSIDRAIYILHRDRPIDDARNKARGMGCFTYCKMCCTKSSYARSAGRASARPWAPVQPRDGARTPSRPILFSTMFKTPPASPNDKSPASSYVLSNTTILRCPWRPPDEHASAMSHHNNPHYSCARRKVEGRGKTGRSITSPA